MWVKPILALLIIKHNVVSEQEKKTWNAGLDDEGSVFFCNWTQKVIQLIQYEIVKTDTWCLVTGTWYLYLGTSIYLEIQYEIIKTN